MGTQNCNYDYNVKGCALTPSRPGEIILPKSPNNLIRPPNNPLIAAKCKPKDFACPLSEDCVGLDKRCDGNYDCTLEEDEQNCREFFKCHNPPLIKFLKVPMFWICTLKLLLFSNHSSIYHLAMCKTAQFPCVVSEQCIPMSARCNGFRDCNDGFYFYLHFFAKIHSLQHPVFHSCSCIKNIQMNFVDIIFESTHRKTISPNHWPNNLSLNAN